MSTQPASSALIIPASGLLEHWQGHRRLTRRVIEAFPDEKLFSFSLGSMRPFGAMAMEMLSMAEPMLRGILTGQWDQLDRESIPRVRFCAGGTKVRARLMRCGHRYHLLCSKR